MTVPGVRYQVSTFGVEKSGKFKLLGKKTGHGVASWEPVSREDLGEPPEWSPVVGRRPVIAILDSGVFKDHPWLPQGHPDDLFVTEESEWERQRPLDVEDLSDEGAEPELGSHLGHGTFVAGIIRQVAPMARIRSFKVMDTSGLVLEENVLHALNWLTHSPRDTVDVVLMAFGRKVEDGDDDTESAQGIKNAIRELAMNKIRVVLSAGNGRSADPVFPACSARTTGHRVASVGGGESKYLKEEYSSWGEWVTDWRLGGEVVSLMPMTPDDPLVAAGSDSLDGAGYAKWSGTSFSAARLAGQHAAGLRLPLG
jgi:hypothetical protein